MTSSWFFLSTLNYDARSTTHQIYRCVHTIMSKTNLSNALLLYSHFKYYAPILVTDFFYTKKRGNPNKINTRSVTSEFNFEDSKVLTSTTLPTFWGQNNHLNGWCLFITWQNVTPKKIFILQKHKYNCIDNRCRCQSITQQYLKSCLIKTASNYMYMFRPIAAIIRFSFESW